MGNCSCSFGSLLVFSCILLYSYHRVVPISSQIIITNDFHRGNMPVTLTVDTDISVCNSDTALAEPGTLHVH